MTGDIFQGDIEFAQRSLAEGHPDEVIIAALEKRRIPRDKGERLLADLRQGHRIDAARASLPRAQRTVEQPRPESVRKQPVRRSKPPGSSRTNRYNRMVLSVVGLAFVVILSVLIFLLMKKSKDSEVENMFEPAVPAATNAVPQP